MLYKQLNKRLGKLRFKEKKMKIFKPRLHRVHLRKGKVKQKQQQ